MIVVDTNVIVYLMLESKNSSKAKSALRKDSDWIAPILWKSEFRNVLALYMRKGMIALEHARNIMEEAERLMQGGEYTVPSSQILSLVKSSGCTAYDCEYIALAKEFNIQLVTTDKKLLSSFPKTTISLERYVEIK